MSLTPSSFDQAEYSRVPEPFPQPVEPGGNNWFARAIAFGVVGALVAAVAYALLLNLPFRFSLFMIGIAYIVAKAMMIGSQDRGGQKYQVASIVLTCVSVGLGTALWIWWDLHANRGLALSLGSLLRVLPYGFAEPFMELSHNPANGALGLFILFIGFRAAWRMTSGLPGASQHPFRRS